tara:strand:- start:11 stop:544 length:534 start_codon:yes stop_codon:yes gene_type:complete
MTTNHSIKSEWVSSPAMAKILGIHRQTLLRLRRSPQSPFVQGRDFRWSGMTTSGNLQWHAATAESTFTNAERIPALVMPVKSDAMKKCPATDDPKLAEHYELIQSFRGRVKRLEGRLQEALFGAQKRAWAHCLVMEKLDPSNGAHALTIKEMQDEIIDICTTTDDMIQFFESYDLHA